MQDRKDVKYFALESWSRNSYYGWNTGSNIYGAVALLGVWQVQILSVCYGATFATVFLSC